MNLTQPPAGTGTVALDANQTVTYTPPASFSGNATFTYRVNDGTATSANTATVTVTVLPVNDAPSFTKGADIRVNEDAGAPERGELGHGHQRRARPMRAVRR